MSLSFHIDVAQGDINIAEIVRRARVASNVGFAGVVWTDHLWHPPPASGYSYEAMVIATWTAAQVPDCAIGHLCLCDSFRHPALLAKQAVTLSEATGGRYELGIGAGSVPAEIAGFGLGSADAKVRVQRLAETLDIVRALWAGETVDIASSSFQIRGGRSLPVPSKRIPIVIGGTSRPILRLVAQHADWWNVRPHEVHRLKELREQVGQARLSVAQIVSITGDPNILVSESSFVASGTPAYLIDYFSALAAQGVERIYLYPVNVSVEAIERLGAEVVAPLRSA